MVTMLAHNLNRDVLTARLFEAGAIFSGSTAAVQEALSLSLGLTSAIPPSPPVRVIVPASVPPNAPFYELKGVIESIISVFAANKPAFTLDGVPAIYEPGRCAAVQLGGKQVASFGQLSTAEATRRKLRQPVYLAEIDLAALLQLPLRHTTAHEISRFQAVERDFSFIFPDAIKWASIEAAIDSLAIADLRSITPIEVWRNEAKFPGVYSTLVRTVFQSNDRTLQESDLTSWSSAIIKALQALGGTLRG